MQKTHQYSSRILSEELEKGENYIDVQEVIEVSFNDFSVLKHDRLINELAITNISTGEVVKEMAWVGYQIDLKVIPEKCYTESEEKIVDYFKIFSYDEEITVNGLKYTVVKKGSFAGKMGKVTLSKATVGDKKIPKTIEYAGITFKVKVVD